MAQEKINQFAMSSRALIISAILAARHCATIDYMGNSNVPLHGIMMKNIWENDILLLVVYWENYFLQKREDV